MEGGRKQNGSNVDRKPQASSASKKRSSHQKNEKQPDLNTRCASLTLSSLSTKPLPAGPSLRSSSLSHVTLSWLPLPPSSIPILGAFFPPFPGAAAAVDFCFFLLEGDEKNKTEARGWIGVLWIKGEKMGHVRTWGGGCVKGERIDDPV